MRCQTIRNNTLMSNPRWVALLATHGLDKDHIFRTDYLTDRFFSTGFRIVNPEFNCSILSLAADQELLRDILNAWDEEDQSAFHNYKTNVPMNPQQRAIWKAAAGLDR